MLKDALARFHSDCRYLVCLSTSLTGLTVAAFPPRSYRLHFTRTLSKGLSAADPSLCHSA